MLMDNHKMKWMGYVGPSALQSRPRTQQFPLVSSPKETSRWEKVRRC